MINNLIQQLSRRLGHYLISADNEIRFNCPFCSETKDPDRKYHLYVHPEKGWICFRCDNKGSIKKLLSKLGIVIDESEITVTIDELEEIIKSLESNVEIQKLETIEYPPEVKPIVKNTLGWNYLVMKRKLSPDIINTYNLMCGRYEDDFRIFIPTFWPDQNSMVYWVARKTFNGSEKCPRYTNPHIKKKPFFFNLHRAKKYSQVIITEGVFSSIAAGENAIAMFGKSISDQQKSILLSTNFSEYVVCLDGDARKELLLLSEFLFDNGKEVTMVLLPDGSDPESIGDEFHKYFDNRIQFGTITKVKLHMGTL